ncbi:prephenate dehydratase domain-containing protein [Blochmannia endosymbiont of Camponotus (Colobopsis) obliquus]|uniref:prephenate dehydratase domain-containing protein n=1 Tax=Blochmannia endosymbiont of Camponotus (Colobopsis) obliquus TaxID=1505597 RepID=UPI00061A6628|nr:prephenate dehydratase domain-containing protein [Blochmannia endosymbiont of Camponotus (Colobopsis) obliquus]AKC60353.1 prephenate dehydratase [Blochmannia endosymbiont of Camponotus (Colobopsis) obliquus]
MFQHNKYSIRIAFLGPKGSYSYIAAKKYSAQYFNNGIEYNSCQKFADIIQVVEKGDAEYGILPIENSTSGFIDEVYDLLKHTNTSLIEEIIIPIKHYLLTNTTNIKFNTIQKIYSHPQPLLQCSNIITRFPRQNIVHCTSTSDAIKTVAKLNIPTIAALGSKFGGILYGLKTLKLNINNDTYNTTRFVVIGYKHNKHNTS